MKLILVDCEATGLAPGTPGGVLTEYGAVEFVSRSTFHGVLHDSEPDPANPAKPLITGKSYSPLLSAVDFERWLLSFNDRVVFVSDNNGYDYMWIAHLFASTLQRNPFGHSSRRISDFYAGLQQDFTKTQQWKKLRLTPHDHNPVNDAMGNAEALQTLFDMQGYTWTG